MIPGRGTITTPPSSCQPVYSHAPGRVPAFAQNPLLDSRSNMPTSRRYQRKAERCRQARADQDHRGSSGCRRRCRRSRERDHEPGRSLDDASRRHLRPAAGAVGAAAARANANMNRSVTGRRMQKTPSSCFERSAEVVRQRAAACDRPRKLLEAWATSTVLMRGAAGVAGERGADGRSPASLVWGCVCIC